MSEIKEYLQKYMESDSDFFLTDADFITIIKELNDYDELTRQHKQLILSLRILIGAISKKFDEADNIDKKKAYEEVLELINKDLGKIVGE